MRCGIIGKPLAHSVSPAFQTAAFRALGIDATYERWETEPGQLAQAIEALRADDVLGANVTVPYKERVVPMLDDVHDDARALGAVNTIVHRGGRLAGHNTDAGGFRAPLEALLAGEGPGHAVVVGAGGAARAVVLALARMGALEIAVLNRTEERAVGLCDALAEVAGVPLMPLGMERATRALRDARVVVNATSVGMAHGAAAGESPLPREALHPGLVVVDLVANPLETPLLRAAAAAGAATLGGLAMLVEQGALAFELWTGQPAPRDIMREAALGATMAAASGEGRRGH